MGGAGFRRVAVGAAAVAISAGVAVVVQSATAPPPAKSTLVVDSAVLREELRRRIEASAVMPPLTVGGQRIHAVATLTAFYERRGFSPAWIGAGGPTPAATELASVVERAASAGLEPDHYHAGAIRSTLERAPRAVQRRTALLADLELLLSDAFLLYGTHLLRGHVNPESIDAEWFAERREADMAAVLADAIATGSVAKLLADLEPPQAGYRRLAAALDRYRNLDSWPEVPGGETLRAGDRSARIATLRERLRSTGDLGEPLHGDPELFDHDLDAAVRGFQQRHGLDADGAVGRRTLAELNRPLSHRVRQIEVNLERWRWLPQDLGRRHVMVNIAGFEVWMTEEGARVLEMRAVVGREQRRTPVFSDQISYLVLNPSWTIPPKLAVEDTLPLIRKDPAYLSRQGIRVFEGWGADAVEVDPATVDWPAVETNAFPYRLRQEPGPLNALGRIKFMFPNRHNIYLHDTPARELFGRSDRDMSSGCIRIEKPVDLAERLLSADAAWTAERLRTALDSGVEQTVRLREPIPVHLQYWTVWVDEAGSVHFRRDLYGRDERLADALHEPPPPGDQQRVQ